jgi:YidC/Oxa1 family membrane protein insertase
LPILIAVFNALGEMPQFLGQPFLWIQDLAYPDVVGLLPFHIPLLGDKVSLLPVLMSGAALLSIFLMDKRVVPKSALRSQRINLVLMSIGFLILFYPFPSAMVLYWAFANLLQFLLLGLGRMNN